MKKDRHSIEAYFVYTFVILMMNLVWDSSIINAYEANGVVEPSDWWTYTRIVLNILMFALFWGVVIFSFGDFTLKPIIGAVIGYYAVAAISALFFDLSLLDEMEYTIDDGLVEIVQEQDETEVSDTSEDEEGKSN